MRKLFRVLAGIMVLAALGNIIGGTDTPVTVRVDPGGEQAVVRADIPAPPRAIILLPTGEKVAPPCRFAHEDRLRAG